MSLEADTTRWTVFTGLGAMGMLIAALAQGQRGRPEGPPPGREPRAHTARQSDGRLELAKSSERPPGTNDVSITVEGAYRVIRSNGIPEHATGPFPGPGNPNPIARQDYELRIAADPKVADESTPLGMHDFGIAVNGVPFDPGAAEWYLGERGSIWQYEPLSGALRMGLDESHAHVQPTGAYHYHGLPTHLLEGIDLDPAAHSPLVGWAADGFPIYALYGHAVGTDPESPVRALRSSYRLKEGKRPSGDGEPGGTYDGTFLADYEYVAGHGDLDECNGRTTVTPEFPDGTYAYFLTETWPVIPRHYRGAPSEDFLRGPRRGPGGGPPRRR